MTHPRPPQLHLSTLLLAVISAAILLGLNLCVESFSASKQSLYGWPLAFIYQPAQQSLQQTFDSAHLLYNILFALFHIVAVAAIWEALLYPHSHNSHNRTDVCRPLATMTSVVLALELIVYAADATAYLYMQFPLLGVIGMTILSAFILLSACALMSDTAFRRVATQSPSRHKSQTSIVFARTRR